MTSYVGRNPAAVGELVRLLRAARHRRARIGSERHELSARPPALPGQPVERAAAERSARRRRRRSSSSTATCRGSRRSSARTKRRSIFHIDVDPLKQQMPLWYIAAKRSFRADAATALRQLNAALDARSRQRDCARQAGRALREHARASVRRCWTGRRAFGRLRRVPLRRICHRMRAQAHRTTMPSSSTKASPTTTTIFNHLRDEPARLASSPAAAGRSAGTAARRSAPSSPRPTS